jgi:serine/threonine-protein kinase
LFLPSEAPHALIRTIVENPIDPPSARGAKSTPEIDAIVMRALAKDPDTRFQTAHEMASALEAVAAPASSRVIGEWIATLLGTELDARAAEVARVERASRVEPPSVATVRTLAFNRLPSGSAPIDSSTTAPVSVRQDPPRPALVQAVAFVIILALSATLGYTWRRVWNQVQSSWSSRAVASTAASSSPSASAPPSMSAAPPPSAEPPPSAVPSASAAPLPAPSASASARAPTPLPRPSYRPASGPPKSCNPPYTIGPPPDYIRKPKLECLPR